MIQPHELKKELPMTIANEVISTTTHVWNILNASYSGDLETVKNMVEDCPELAYAQYNYTPPVHFAVREGHTDLVGYLLDMGAYDPAYRIYPFLDALLIIAQDRGYDEIALMLEEYTNDPSRHKYNGDNGNIHYQRTALQLEFEKAVVNEDLEKTEMILKSNPEFASDDTWFWGEGILTFAVKKNKQDMIGLLLSYGAKVPAILKWTQFYYFEHFDAAAFIMKKGMNPDTMSWHHVTILHDMAQKGNMQKAALLIKYGAAINPVEEEYRSTPLGMAARWGHHEMVDFLLKEGADPNKSGAAWSTPLAWARKKGHAEIEKILIKAGAE
ncbi:MAG: ankyrin repeat domain-containing protein [Bacteroidota bacterium]